MLCVSSVLVEDSFSPFQLQGVLARLVESAVRFDAESGFVEVSHSLKSSNAEYVELQRVLEAMDVSTRLASTV